MCCFGSEADLHMTALALELCCTMMTDRISSQSVGLTVRHKVLPQALILIRSSLLQGQALQVSHRNFGCSNVEISSIFLCTKMVFWKCCRHYKDSLHHWFIQQIQALTHYWIHSFQVLSLHHSLGASLNKLFIQLHSVLLYFALQQVIRNVHPL